MQAFSFIIYLGRKDIGSNHSDSQSYLSQWGSNHANDANSHSYANTPCNHANMLLGSNCNHMLTSYHAGIRGLLIITYCLLITVCIFTVKVQQFSSAMCVGIKYMHANANAHTSKHTHAHARTHKPNLYRFVLLY